MKEDYLSLSLTFFLSLSTVISFFNSHLEHIYFFKNSLFCDVKCSLTLLLRPYYAEKYSCGVEYSDY